MVTCWAGSRICRNPCIVENGALKGPISRLRTTTSNLESHRMTDDVVGDWRKWLVFNLLLVSIFPPLCRPLSLRSAYLSSISNFTRTCWQLPGRAFSSVSDSPDDLFNYSSGRWLVHDDLRLAERRREFDVDELCRLAAQSVGRSSQAIDTFVKLTEGYFNRTYHYAWRLRDGSPHPVPRHGLQVLCYR